MEMKEEKEEVCVWPSRVMGVQITNTTNKEQEFKLFGFAKYAHVEGYGNPKGIIVENLQNNDGYASMLYASGTQKKPIKIKGWRFFGNESNVTKCYTVHHEAIDGLQLTSPINLEEKERIQHTEGGDCILSLDYSFTVDSESHITGRIDGMSKVVIHLYFEYVN